MDVSQCDTEILAKWKQTPIQDSLLVAHVTDTHLIRPDEDRPEVVNDFPTSPWSVERLRDAVEEIRGLTVKPDLLLLGGDNTHNGEAAEWALLLEVLAPTGIPFLVALGNREHRNDLPESTAFETSVASLRSYGCPDSQVADRWAFRTTVAGYQFVILDSMHSGDLGAEQHAFLNAALATGMPTVISVHRPVILVGNSVDPFRLIDPVFEDIVQDTENVTAVICGHVHRRRAMRHRNRLHLIGASTCIGGNDRTGYRLFCLAEGQVAWSATRFLPGPSVHKYQCSVVGQVGELIWEQWDD